MTYQLSDPSTVASRLRFDCRPKAEFLGLRVDGRHVVFHENVFYRFAEGRIQEVWSVIDRVEMKATIIDKATKAKAKRRDCADRPRYSALAHRGTGSTVSLDALSESHSITSVALRSGGNTG